MKHWQMALMGSAIMSFAFVAARHAASEARRRYQQRTALLERVTAERDKLAIQNAGLKSELARVCVENEKMVEGIAAYALEVTALKENPPQIQEVLKIV